MTSPIDAILAKTKAHCKEVTMPNVDGTTEISHAVIGHSLQKCAEGLPAAHIPKGHGQ